jgi:hypothetical protein
MCSFLELFTGQHDSTAIAQVCDSSLVVICFDPLRRRIAMRIAASLLLALIILLPARSVFPEPPQRDVPAEVDSARQKLRSARNDLEHAGGDWGGHRVNAMNQIDQALKELNEAERWAREHHDIH